MPAPSQAMISLLASPHALIHDEAHLRKLIKGGKLKGIDEGSVEATVAKVQGVGAERREAIQQYVDKLAREFPDPRFERLGFNLVATKIPNALAIHVREDDSYAIGLDPTIHEMLTWLLVTAHWAYQRKEPEIFLQLAVNFVRLGFLNMDLPPENEDSMTLFVRAIRPEHEQMGSWTLAIAAAFLVGHEMGHIYLGHFHNGKPFKMQFVPAKAEKDAVAGFSAAHEHEADEWAAKAVLQISKTGIWENVLARTLPSILFSIIAVIDDLYWPTTPLATHIRQSHPPASLRAEKLQQIGAIDKEIPFPDELAALFALSDWITSKRLEPKFQEFAQKHREHYARLGLSAGVASNSQSG
jgi:hypothetical protein